MSKGMWGRKTPCNYTAKREIHVAAMQTCGSSEHARPALCSAMRHYACSALYECMNA